MENNGLIRKQEMKRRREKREGMRRGDGCGGNSEPIEREREVMKEQRNGRWMFSEI